MAQLITNRGLQVIGDRASAVSPTPNPIQTLSIDDSTVALAAGHTALNSGGAVTNEADVAFDSTPTRSGQVVSHVATVPAGTGTMFVRRIALHNEAPGSVSSSSATLIGGVDAQSFDKPSTLALKFTLKITYTAA